MFSWFRKRPTELAFDDRVWLNDAARTAAIVRTAQAGPTLIVTFFEESAQVIAGALKQAGLSFEQPGYGQTIRGEGLRDVLCAAERIGNVTGRLPPTAQVCIAEHHPLPESNLALLEGLAPLTDARPVFHVSIDDPLLRRFGGEKVASLMGQLGVSADEPIEHAMVTRALANARDKVAQKVKSAQPARSMEEWLQFNFDADRR